MEIQLVKATSIRRHNNELPIRTYGTYGTLAVTFVQLACTMRRSEPGTFDTPMLGVANSAKWIIVLRNWR
jgi:hypothetical protein